MKANKKYIKAQELYIEIAKDELRRGRKETHWIWFVFPQLKGLGKSFVSEYYGLRDLDEAKDFFQDKYLRKNLLDCFKIILKYEDKEQLANSLGMMDSIKICSCATLFYIATKKLIFKKFLNKFFDGLFDQKTMLLLDER